MEAVSAHRIQRLPGREGFQFAEGDGMGTTFVYGRLPLALLETIAVAIA
jgi:hypothetical protein